MHLAPCQAHAETLIDAIDLAYTTNPALRAERDRARAADEGIAQARGGVLPTVTVQGSGGISQNERFGRATSAGITNPDPESVSIQAVQPIFRGGRTFYGFQQATAAARAAHAVYRSAEQQFLLSVVSTYMDVRRDEESVRIRENNVSVLRRQLEAAQARFDVGEGTKTDIAQAEARLSGGDAGLSLARAQLDVSRSAYERFVGQ
ncbi:MAG: TolC family protein [Caulobacterales bacterium]